MTYPGAAELDSTTDCLTDADGDGYGTHEKDLDVLQLPDKILWGDGWNSDAIIDVAVDGFC